MGNNSCTLFIKLLVNSCMFVSAKPNLKTKKNLPDVSEIKFVFRDVHKTP